MTTALRPAVLRPARYQDGYVLWLWANDGETRRWSGNRGPIHFEQHMTWLGHRLADRSTLLLMADDEQGCPVGSVRFETIDGWRSARLSYVIGPKHRGNGRSRPLVSEAVARLDALHPGTVISADVMNGNVASLRVFRGLEWGEKAAANEMIQFRRVR